MAKKSVELRQQKKAIYDQAHELITRVESGTSELLPEERAKWDKMNTDMNELDLQIKTAESMEARAKEFASGAYEDGSADEKTPKKSAEQRSYDEQFNEVLRNGLVDSEVRSLNQKFGIGINNKVEFRGTANQLTTSSTKGGLLVPELWANNIEVGMQAWGEVLGAVTKFNTAKGGKINMPYRNEFIKGRIIGEGASTVVSDMTWGTKAIDDYKYTSDQIVLSYELLQDAAYNVESFVNIEAAERIGLALAADVTNGDGSTKPEGILQAADASGKVTVGSAITTELITGLEHTVNRAYRDKSKARFMMHDSTVEALKLLSIGSSDDRPLWQMSMRDGTPDTINGYQYITNDEMPELSGSTGDKVIAFGDFSKYSLRQVGGFRLKRFEEIKGLDDLVVFVAFARYDGKLLISNAIKTLAIGA